MTTEVKMGATLALDVREMPDEEVLVLSLVEGLVVKSVQEDIHS